MNWSNSVHCTEVLRSLEMFLEIKDWCQLLIWIFFTARGWAVPRPIGWEETMARGTPRKEKVRILPFQFLAALGIKTRAQLVSVTQMRLSGGGKAIACLCDHYAKQSCPAWRTTACAAGKSSRKVWRSSSDLLGWLHFGAECCPHKLCMPSTLPSPF